MERLVVKNEAERHLQAYLEYRMIVGDRDGGVLLPENEYEKLRKEFYAKREKHNLHFVDTSYIGGTNKRHQPNSEEMKYEKSKSDPSKSKTRILKPNVSLLDLYKTPPKFEFHNDTMPSSNSRISSRSSSANYDSLKVTRVNSAKRIVSGSSKEASKQLPTVSRFQIQNEDDDQVKLDSMIAQLQNDTSLSEAKKYYLKKQIQLLKAKITKAAKNE
ncbi:hypothetical protein C9374_005123 [Naegleria lovaniensis]|uniref:Uncharacterized protein n=1 Tax=Naegleria lovaniensis TaxID=51637 RepID=A0AA88GQY0_NAELO|nr:uncharacterized protein C9374_005123 [Naegleria lovaniensis]KAG2382543.1 hypothetical protein C9374_005123 [Naegleria lovaniensis]